MDFAGWLDSNMEAGNLLTSNLSLFPAPRVIPVNVYQDESRAPAWEQAMFVAWFFALYLPLLAFTPIRYGCICVMLGLFFVYRHETIPLLQKSWPLLPYPILSLFSIFWTDYPVDGLRSVMLGILTPISLITVAARLRPSEFLRVMMLAGALASLYCIPYFGTLSEGGPLPQKNLLAYQFMLVTLIALATALNHQEQTIFRLIALAVAPLAFYIQLSADSATSLVFAVLGSVILIGIKVFWVAVGNVAHLRSALLALIISGLLAIAFVLLSMPEITFVRDFLELVGKDPTLTGRTGIWNAAEMVSAQHPWFGVGVEGFWQPNTGLAQTLNELNHTAPGSKISFHSAFWEVRVHFGFVGLGFFILSMVWAGWRTLGLWLRDGSVINSALLIFYCIIATSCFTESYPAGSFSTIVAVFYFGALAAFDVGARKLIGQGRLVENPA